jgi:mono/diheme cytochrome c family protein
MRRTRGQWIRLIVLIVVGAFLLIQLVPYGRDHTNPPGRQEPNWDSARTRQLAVDACFACHSNETEWPWYSNVAPISWRLQNHVDEGRSVLNFSEWGRNWPAAGEAAETVQEGEMPPWDFKLAHSEARLSDSEKTELARGLQATLGGSAARASAPSGP